MELVVALQRRFSKETQQQQPAETMETNETQHQQPAESYSDTDGWIRVITRTFKVTSRAITSPVTGLELLMGVSHLLLV